VSDTTTALRPAAAMEGASVALPDGALVPSALEQLLERGRVRATLAMLGPAFVAAIAYVDPGNFATNLQGGARFGYLLLWVVLVANLMAMLIQYLSAKLGIATDRDLPELCRERFPRAVTWGLWAQAEIMAMSTDIAEFLGAALGLNLLFGVPLLPAGLITGAVAFAILELQTRGYRRFELAISALLGIVFLGFLYEALRIGPSASGSLQGLLPGVHGTSYMYLAVGIVGATVMPHAIYLHSAMMTGRVQARTTRERRRLRIDFQRQVAQLSRRFGANDLAHLLERDVFIVAGDCLSSRREDGLGQRVGLLQTRGQLDSAHAAGSFVFLPRGAGNIAADHALHREHLRAPHQHGAAPQLVGVFARRLRIMIDVGSNHVVRHDAGKKVEPEKRNLRQHPAFVGNAGG